MRLIILLYTALVYLAFLAVFTYLIGFIFGDAQSLLTLPKTIDAGPSPISGWPSALVNIALLILFGLQHSIMARPAFKRALTKVVARDAERSTYVLATLAVLVVLFVFWTPMPGTVWSTAEPVWQGILTVGFLLGAAIILLSSFLINHFELFGLMQGWYAFQKKQMPTPVFRTPLFYKWVRHPLYLGILLLMWSTPHMTVGHLLFAAIWTAYIFIAVGYEERDLIATFGQQYHTYMDKTPTILPFGHKK